MESGDTIGGRYRLDRKIGEGGTGRIWLAQDRRLDRRVAIKFLFASSKSKQTRLAKRVALEAKIAASIQHRNVIQIFDFGAHKGDIPYIVMEALTGFTLAEAFDTAQSFSLDTLIYVMSEVLRGLSAVHDAGIVHRDLKPANIFLVKEARGKLSPKLLDFGISRSLEPDTRSSAVTTTEGLILGTPQYMSPEQARGDSEIDLRTDIYSFGTIMFEAFSGMVPFPVRGTPQLLVAIIHHEAPPLHEMVPLLGESLCSVVDKALTKERDKRYAHAAEMLDALVAASHELPVELDRQAPLFPPLAFGNRLASGLTNATTQQDSEAPAGAHVGPHAPETVRDPGSQRRRRTRPPGGGDSLPVEPLVSEPPFVSDPPFATDPPLSAAPRKRGRGPISGARAVWLALGGLIVFGASVAVALTLIDRSREPQGSGLIVVQAPSAASAPAEPEPPPVAAEEPALSAALGEITSLPAKKGKARRPSPAAPVPLMPVRVAEAFTKQRSGVVACLNEHAAELEGASELQVRLLVDRSGAASDAELLPASISSKPVARCLKAAVTSMSFPRQGEPTTFRVPLSWRRK